MQLEAVFSLLEDTEAEGLVADSGGVLWAEDRLGEPAIDERHRGEDRETGSDGRVEPAVELGGEELVQRLGTVGVRVRGIGGHACKTDDRRPTAREREETGSELSAGAVENLLDLLGSHRKGGLRYLEHLAVQDAAGTHPRGARAARKEHLHVRPLDHGLHERLGRGRDGEVLVIVDRDPAVVRPFLQVLDEHVREEEGLALGVVRDRQALEHASAGAVDVDRGGGRETASDDGDVCSRTAGTEPADRPAVAGSPLLRQRRLPVARAAHEHAEPGARPVEGVDQSGPLDDPAPTDSRLPWLICHPGSTR